MSDVSAPSPLLEVTGVRVCYESVEVIHGVDLAIAPGSVTAVLGPNGAGKSTLLSVLAGLHRRVGRRGALRRRTRHGGQGGPLVRQGLCLIPEGKGIFPNLTVQENLWMMSHGGVTRAARSRAGPSSTSPSCPLVAISRRRTMSGGEQQMLAMARAVSTAAPPPPARRALHGPGTHHRRVALRRGAPAGEGGRHRHRRRAVRRVRPRGGRVCRRHDRRSDRASRPLVRGRGPPARSVSRCAARQRERVPQAASRTVRRPGRPPGVDGRARPRVRPGR